MGKGVGVKVGGGVSVAVAVMVGVELGVGVIVDVEVGVCVGVLLGWGDGVGVGLAPTATKLDLSVCSGVIIAPVVLVGLKGGNIAEIPTIRINARLVIVGFTVYNATATLVSSRITIINKMTRFDEDLRFGRPFREAPGVGYSLGGDNIGGCPTGRGNLIAASDETRT